ncbi:MAG: family 78 glycoside hydrolase catalytic domain [Deltaproteobacteria bacterium]|nr:family 78 glycoside hydrolase catalytic domain [Deltaproteobacteria bacterium]
MTRLATLSIPVPEIRVARWIEPAEAANAPARQRPACYLAGELEVTGAIESACLHATAHGVYEAFLNGTRVGDCELTPGFTAYRKRLQVQTSDVTDLLKEGRNALGAILSDGWWRGQSGIARRVNDYGVTTAFLAELVVTLKSGEVMRFGTDSTWRSRASHILRADLIAGEVHDLRLRVTGWAEPGTDRSAWDIVRVADYGIAELCESPAPPVRRVEELRPVSIRELAPQRWVVDFGQNSNGWVRLRKLGPAGTQITLTYGEAVDREGDVTQANVASGTSMQADSSVTFQVDTVISAGIDGDVFESRHSTKGFRYVRLEGHPGPLERDNIASIVVHTDLPRLGSFACSDDRVNALHRIAEWSFRSNACDIPTDCPTRERAGWTGDWQIYVETAAYLYDVAGFSTKWLRDLAAEQWPNGAVTNLVPEPHPMDDREPPYWKDLVGSAGWGDAAVHVPWEIYRATGNQQLVAEQWPSMAAWVEFAARAAASARHPSRVERAPEPAPHERCIWDSGFHFGEWLEPGQSLADAISLAVASDHGALATAYLYRSASELAQMAAVLGRRADAERYGRLAESARAAWQREFIGGGGRITPHTQATLVRALAFDLVPQELRAPAANDLVALIRAAGTHLGTGFLSTAFLLPVLADTGHLEVAYELLFQDTEPSWLLMSARGSTTIWEEWGGIDVDGVAHASLNHYSKGAVISFLHRYVAGLQIVEPGYRRFRVAPRPGGGITGARTHHDSPHGRIEISWQLTDAERGSIEITVPPGTAADLVLPDGTTDVLLSSTHRRVWGKRDGRKP